ncbi:MAG TPA: Grx4 family monothiol glutaredoxin [Acidiferrobacteraceae bacterium]|nr:Grx4 family monothiol glutaredoxin [Acidiferrobacteraceae bacterium]
MDVNEKIKQQLAESDVVLYMKGTPQFPQCGFSGKSVQLLKACGVAFKGVDVLADPEIREGIKRYSNWPTVPQLYVRGEFIGGSDIMGELYAKGELQRILGVAQAR